MVSQMPLLEFKYADRSDWAANVLLFVPIGFCLLAACSADSGKRITTIAAIPVILAGCFALSFLIEFGQLWLPARVFSQADIVAHTIGTVIGIVGWLTLGQAFTNWLRSYSGTASPKRQVDWLLEVYLVGLILYSVVPLNLTINPEELYDKFDKGRVELIPFSNLQWNWTTCGNLLIDLVIFIPVGGLAAVIGRPAERPLRPLAESIVLGGFIVTGIELSQLFVLARFTSTTDIIVGTAGVAVGAWLRHRFSPPQQAPAAAASESRRWQWLLWTLLYALIVVAYFWIPFEVTDDRDLIRRRFQMILQIPGASLLSVSEYRAVTEILRKTLLFLPLGGLLVCCIRPDTAPATSRPFLLALCLLIAAGIGLIIEVGQVLIIEHTPDTSDALLCALGAAAGIFITDRLLRHRADER